MKAIPKEVLENYFKYKSENIASNNISNNSYNIYDNSVNDKEEDRFDDIVVNSLKEKEDLIIKADNCYKERKWDEAYRCYGKLAKIDPGVYTYWLRKGVSQAIKYHNVKLLEESIVLSLKCLDDNITDEDFYKIADDCYDAIKLIEDYYEEYMISTEQNDYNSNVMYDCIESLLICSKLYAVLADLFTDDEKQAKIYKNVIDMLDNILDKEYYAYYNGRSLIPDKTMLGRIYPVRNQMVSKYNFLVKPKYRIRRKKIMSFVTLRKILIFVLLVIIVTCLVLLHYYPAVFGF